MKKLLVISLLIIYIVGMKVNAQTTTQSVVVNSIANAGKLVKWTPIYLAADSTTDKWSNYFTLADVDNASTVTGFYTYDLLPAAQYSMKVIHYVNNYSSLDASGLWMPKDTISITGGTPESGSITFSKGAYHKFRTVNSGSSNTLSFGIYFSKQGN